MKKIGVFFSNESYQKNIIRYNVTHIILTVSIGGLCRRSC